MSDDATGQPPDHGIPDEACDAQPKGYPTSDRLQSETAPAERGGNKHAPKHSHEPEKK